MNNIGKIQNIKLQLKNLESQFENLEIQMNSLIMPPKIDIQIKNIGIQLLNLGIQTLNIYKEIPNLRTDEEENQFNQNIENINQQLKRLFFPQKYNQMDNLIDNMNNMDNNMMRQNMMGPMMMIGMNPQNQQMMNNPVMIAGMNPLEMNNNLMDNSMDNQEDSGLNNPIFKIMSEPNNTEEDNTTGVQNPILESYDEGYQDPLSKKIKIIFKRMDGKEKTKYYSYFNTKVCDMLRDYIFEENLKKDTSFQYNGNKLSKLNQNYICDILNDNSVIQVLA